MVRLTNHDDQGNWSLKGVKWEKLHEGAAIDKKTSEKLYAALWKLKDYEDAEVDPEQVQNLKERNTGMLLEDIRGKKDKGHIRFGTCPNCRKLVSDVEGENFCKNCGQRINWGKDS